METLNKQITEIGDLTSSKFRDETLSIPDSGGSALRNTNWVKTCFYFIGFGIATLVEQATYQYLLENVMMMSKHESTLISWMVIALSKGVAFGFYRMHKNWYLNQMKGIFNYVLIYTVLSLITMAICFGILNYFNNKEKRLVLREMQISSQINDNIYLLKEAESQSLLEKEMQDQIETQKKQKEATVSELENLQHNKLLENIRMLAFILLAKNSLLVSALCFSFFIFNFLALCFLWAFRRAEKRLQMTESSFHYYKSLLIEKVALENRLNQMIKTPHQVKIT